MWQRARRRFQHSCPNSQVTRRAGMLQEKARAQKSRPQGGRAEAGTMQFESPTAALRGCDASSQRVEATPRRLSGADHCSVPSGFCATRASRTQTSDGASLPQLAPTASLRLRVLSSAEAGWERCRWGRRRERSGRRGVPETGAAGSCQPSWTGSQPRGGSHGVRPSAAADAPRPGGVGRRGLHRVSTASASAKVICRQRDLALGAWGFPRSLASS
jgi:hypothetical protein